MSGSRLELRKLSGLPAQQWLTTREAADLLRLAPRTVYHLVSRGEVPHARARGKLLFERSALQAWVAAQSAGTLESGGAEPPACIAGSHDPLLEWALRECRSGLSLSALGSTDGVDRLVARAACAALIHIPNRADPGFNLEAIASRAPRLPLVMLQWARREQGLLVAPGNPLGIHRLDDLIRDKRRVVLRHPGAGSHLLMMRLLHEAGLKAGALRAVATVASSEFDVAQSVAEGVADAGFGIRAAAASAGLDFVSLAWETIDLVIWRRMAFEPPMQALLEFARSRAFARRARLMQGYDLSGALRVRLNG